jgi:hypothetical protein
MKTFYIQSFYQYPVTFSSIGKTIPARSAQGELRNVAEFTEKEIDTLEKREPLYRELKDKKKIRVLNHLPSSYVPPAQRINEANDEAEKLRKELEAAKAKIAELEAGKAPAEETISDGATEGLTDEDRKKQYEEMTYAELQDACKYVGIEYKNKKKAALIEELVALKK